MKLQEEIIGLVEALQIFAEEDEDAENQRYREMCQKVVDALIETPGLDVSVEHDEWDYLTPIAIMRFTRDWRGPSRNEVDAAMATGDPPIYLHNIHNPDELAVDPFNLETGARDRICRLRGSAGDCGRVLVDKQSMYIAPTEADDPDALKLMGAVMNTTTLSELVAGAILARATDDLTSCCARGGPTRGMKTSRRVRYGTHGYRLMTSDTTGIHRRTMRPNRCLCPRAVRRLFSINARDICRGVPEDYDTWKRGT